MADADRYYEEELAYLVEAGREYARAHPERARYLALEDPRARDPHVERLIEAVAFLTGSVRKRLDDDFPELTHGLIDLVWPHYLRPVPAMAMVQFEPLPGMVRSRQTVPKGYLMQSRPTSAGVPCRFRTAYAVDLYPLALTEVKVATDASGAPRLVLRLALTEGAKAEDLAIDRLRLHIAGEPAVASGIYNQLRSNVAGVSAVFDAQRRRELGADALRPVGFARDEDLLPYPRVSFPGYRLLSEYFAFPEKYLFVDLVGLGTPDLSKDERSFTVEIRFTERPPDAFHPTPDNLKLFVTPAVNLFAREGEPVRVTGVRTAYRVLGDATHPDAYEIVSVDDVIGLRSGDGRRRQYPPFLAFDHDRLGGDGTFFHTSHRVSPAGAWRTYISLITPGQGDLPAEEMLSLEVTCTNGRLCREVGIGEVTRPGEERLDFARFANLTRPTEPVYPHLGRGSEWRFISHMALNFLSLEDAATARGLLGLYNVGDRQAHRRRIAGLKTMRAVPRELLVGGVPVRGTLLELEVEESHYDDPGDLRLFTEVLSRFIGMYAGINSFAQLEVRTVPSQEVLRWPAVQGDQKLI